MKSEHIVPEKKHHPARFLRGGPDGNDLLTAVTGGVLLALIVFVVLTLFDLRNFLSVHMFLGLVLIPPLLLKLSSVGYRFAHYYARTRAYVEKGPPQIMMRILAPFLVLLTVILFGSGVALLFAGPSSKETLLPIHKISFIVWAAVVGLHIIVYLPKAGSALKRDYANSIPKTERVSGRDGRAIALTSALVLGLVLALLALSQFGPWVHDTTLFHHHHH